MEKFLRYFLFSAWNDNLDGYKEILVIAKDEEEAEKKLYSRGEYKDYSFEEELDYEEVIV